MIQSIKQPHPVKLGAHFLPPKTALDLVGRALTGHKKTDDRTMETALTDLVCAKLVKGNPEFLEEVCGLFLVHQNVLGIVTPSALINNANAQNLKIKTAGVERGAVRRNFSHSPSAPGV